VVPGHRFVLVKEGFTEESLPLYNLYRSAPTRIGQGAFSRQQCGQFLA
jgi:hypothetical protein